MGNGPKSGCGGTDSGEIDLGSLEVSPDKDCTEPYKLEYATQSHEGKYDQYYLYEANREVILRVN